MSTLERTIPITADHIAMLRAVDEAGGSMPLSRLVEVLTPGAVMAARMDTFGLALRGAQVAGELRRWGMLDRLPFSTRRQITDAGRAALDGRAKGAVA